MVNVICCSPILYPFFNSLYPHDLTCPPGFIITVSRRISVLNTSVSATTNMGRREYICYTFANTCILQQTNSTEQVLLVGYELITQNNLAFLFSPNCGTLLIHCLFLCHIFPITFSFSTQSSSAAVLYQV